MSKQLTLAALLLFAGGATAAEWMTACSSSSNNPSDGGSSSSSSSSGGSGSNSGSSSGGVKDGSSEGGNLGLLIDNMTAPSGTQLSLMVPADSGQTAGSYYAYADIASLTMSTMQLKDVPVMPNITNSDGSVIQGELCFGGNVAQYAGLGMNLIYIPPPADAAAGATSSPTPFDASAFHGVSFYINVSPDESGAGLPTIHFGVPDTQTADKAAYPMSACNVVDGGICDDDFGSDVTFVAGQWTKASFTFKELQQQNFGTSFDAIKSNALIGMKWQANGGGADAGQLSFNFCISDIYLTP